MVRSLLTIPLHNADWAFLQEMQMSIAKVIEVNSSSTKSFEDAIKSGISKVSTTVDNVAGAWVNEQKVVVKEGEIVEYRVNLKISFVVE